MQIQLGDGTTRKRSHGTEGLTKEDLFKDRKACFRAGLKLLRNSVAACSKHGQDAQLNAYASGVCGLGHQRSKEMLAIARRMLSAKTIPAADKDFVLAEPNPDTNSPVKPDGSLSLLESH